jgi:hypothetical protein
MSTINEFLKSKEITEDELKANFKLLTSFTIADVKERVCPNCRDTHNNKRLPAGSWTSVMHCWACNSISFIVYGDKMGGGFDTVNIYKDHE